MRSEQEMIGMVLGMAEKDERVRAVTLEGSRTNPNVPKDLFRDYDISFHVTDMQSYIDQPDWVDAFGERILMQIPEAMAMFPPDLGNRFSYLMLFKDGNRIDMTLIPIEEKDDYVKEDKLMQVLLDKDGLFPDVLPSTDVDYWVKKPSAEFYADCCNEFWWVATYVAKGLWRKEMLYAQDHLNNLMRPMLVKMLEWQAGIRTDFSLSVGKNGKFLDRYIPEDSWQKLMATYPAGSYESVWQALFLMGELFRETGQYVASELGFLYPLEEDCAVTAYLDRVRRLDPDAKSM
ncbi:aminoglycoside 6-adenylyltransferase [Paenibacillus sp. 1011MAR3C5]|uniref:aminoglycoside 6-adenylyltransferase n=1 Tax=Paenibacillus sp. 1011MAR3C5 TaxID=1675787 RepID=UPI000E6C5543|nr:aminoglycoside 6-adenylyltransferase [Paenibacillus sp. 1011MAR3C5]RJE85172.1 aminoglycoside 6-adenylyltransferase [Paenibacillus sp. 1011MAR3C5]